MGVFFQEITSITEFSGSNFLLPTILTGNKWDFQAANLLLAPVNFEPWMLSVNLTLNFQTLYAKALLFFAKKFEELCSAFFFCKKILQ